MNRKLLNRTGMAGTVSAYMNKNQTIWSGNVAIVETVADLDAALAQTGQKAGLQETPITGAASQKVQTRHDFEEEVLMIASQISAMAAKNNDLNLVAQAELTLPQLDKMPDDELEETGTRISGLATANLAALADYGITAVDVTNLNNLTTQFHSLKTAPRTAIAERAAQTKTLPPVVKTITSILRNRLDKQMLIFKSKNPEFYAGYLSARVIVDRSGSNHVTPAPAQNPPAK
jgi:hypothetical protein